MYKTALNISLSCKLYRYKWYIFKCRSQYTYFLQHMKCTGANTYHISKIFFLKWSQNSGFTIKRTLLLHNINPTILKMFIRWKYYILIVLLQRLIPSFEYTGRVLCHTYYEYVLTLHQIRIILSQYLISGRSRPYWILLLTISLQLIHVPYLRIPERFLWPLKSYTSIKKQHLKSQFGSFLLAAIILSSIGTSADGFTKYTRTHFVQRTFLS